jgi:DNA 3'-phosphatase
MDSKSKWDYRKSVFIRYPQPEYKFLPSVVLISLPSIIEHPTGKKIPFDKSDWKFINNNVISKLEEMQRDGACLCILDNYFALSRGKVERSVVTKMIDNICNLLEASGIYIMVILMIKNDTFSKPFTNSWYILQDLFCNMKPKVSESIYIGTNGGRTALLANSKFKKCKKDNDYIDRAFAENLGLTYVSYDEIFCNCMQNRPWAYPNFILTSAEKKQIIESCNREEYETTMINIEQTIKKFLNRNILILLCGRPGSGKTTLSKHIFSLLYNNYNTNACKKIENKSINTPKKLLTVMANYLSENINIIIDGYNASVDDRKDILKLADSRGYACIIIYCDVPERLAYHLNRCKIQTTSMLDETPASSNLFSAFNKKNMDQLPTEDEYPTVRRCKVIVYKLMIESKPWFWYTY